MKEVYLFFENDKVLGVFDNFAKFRKTTFHYILGFLVKNKKYGTKLEAGKSLKKNFSDFFGKSRTDIVVNNDTWASKVFILNELDIELEKENKNITENYVTEFTKIEVLKGTTSFKSLNHPLNYIKLSPLYGK